MDAVDCFEAAMACLRAGDRQRLRELVDLHPEVLDLRIEDDDTLNLLHLASKKGDCRPSRDVA